MGLFIGFYYVGSYSRNILGTSDSTSINLLLTMNGVGVPGWTIPNFVTDRIGPLNMIVPVAAISSVLLHCWDHNPWHGRFMGIRNSLWCFCFMCTVIISCNSGFCHSGFEEDGNENWYDRWRCWPCGVGWTTGCPCFDSGERRELPPRLSYSQRLPRQHVFVFFLRQGGCGLARC